MVIINVNSINTGNHHQPQYRNGYLIYIVVDGDYRIKLVKTIQFFYLLIRLSLIVRGVVCFEENDLSKFLKVDIFRFSRVQKYWMLA